MSNSTNRSRAARRLAAELGIKYQHALNAIINATEPETRKTKTRETPTAGEPYYPMPDSEYAWNQFPLGRPVTIQTPEDEDREIVLDFAQDRHVIIVGRTGAGTSILTREITTRALRTGWLVVGVDPKQGILNDHRNYPNMQEYSITLHDIENTILNVEDEMKRRYDLMRKAGVNNIDALEPPLPRILLVIEEAYPVLAPVETSTPEGIEINTIHRRLRITLGSIARLGRSSGVHMAITTTRPEENMFEREFLANISARIVIGNLNDPKTTDLYLEKPIDETLPARKGTARILYSAGGKYPVWEEILLYHEPHPISEER